MALPDLPDVSGTLLVAIYGAVTGTIAAVVAVRNRADVTWTRRAKVTGEVRPALVQLRDALAEAKARPDRITTIRTLRVRADLEIIDDVQPRCADRDLRDLLKEAHVACSVVPTAPAGDRGTLTYKQVELVDRALAAVTRAIARIDVIDRRAPK